MASLKSVSELDEGRLATSNTISGGTNAVQNGAQIVGGEKGGSDKRGPGPQVMAADTLVGDDVKNANGETLGEVEAIMLDIETGRIAYAVLSFGGLMGLANKLFAIPWQALTLDADNKCFILQVENQSLDSAPGFDKDNWPEVSDMQWAQSIHLYYGARPYWE